MNNHLTDDQVLMATVASICLILVLAMIFI